MILLYIGLLLLGTNTLFRKKFSVYWGFLLVLLVMGFQTAQTDYISYGRSFYLIKELIKFGYEDNLRLYSVFDDWGWTWINILFSFSIFPVMVFSIAFIQYYILCKFTKTFVSPSAQYLAPILFYFTFPFMLMQMTAMRQGFAIELCLAAVTFLHEKKYGASFVLCLLAYLVHGTALLGIAVVIFYAVNQKWGILSSNIRANDWFFPSLFTGFYLLLYLIKDTFVGNLSVILLSLYKGDYSSYFSQIEFTNISSLYVLYNGVMVFISMYFYKYASVAIRVFIIAAVIGNYTEMLFFGLGDIPRIFMYFSIYGIVVLPNIACFLQRKFNDVVCCIFVVFCIGYAFKSFLPHIGTGGYFSTFEFVF